jgi:uncharacterized protein (TIGR03790 family)
MRGSLGIANRLCGLSVALATALMAPAFSLAGGGPENVMIVVNARDRLSRTIANHYCDLRFIPDCNVFELDWAGSDISTTVDVFRTNIIEPVLQEIERRKLTGQIDYIVYSSGFPFAIDFTSDFRGKSLPQEVGSMASITGLTYLCQLTRARDTSYAQPMVPSNYYATYSTNPAATRAMRSSYNWSRTGHRVQALGSRYYLSTMLGYTSGRGNSVDEIVRYLRRSAMADCTHPPGTIYYLRNNDVRSTTRESAFPVAQRRLIDLGIKTELLDNQTPNQNGILPIGKKDVMGALVGYANFSWEKCGSRILPGAICEHLTSYGGILNTGAGQTPLSEFLRFGAAGASGTVMEPLALQTKFPHPTIHCHYAAGCSLAEAFYQSVACPYQLLIIGDPLCRPWANAPIVEVSGLADGDVVRGKITIQPTTDGRVPIRAFHLFIDGREAADWGVDGKLEVDTSRLADGYHEFRIVAVENSAIESQGRRIISCWVDNRNRKIECQVSPSHEIPATERLSIRVSAPDAKEVIVYHRRRPLARIARPEGNLLIDPSDLGTGPVTLTLVAKSDRGMANAWFARPIRINVLPVESPL